MALLYPCFNKSHSFRKLLILLLLIFSCLAFAQEESMPDTEEPELQLPLDEVRIFTEVLNRIRNAYVEPIDDKTLLENAIKGMLAGIDPTQLT